MSPDERASRVIAELVSEIRRDLEALEGAHTRVVGELGRVPPGGPSQPQLAFFALHLDRAYSASEAAFLRIARSIDRDAPGGPGWHASLLRQMLEPVPGLRPAVLRAGTAARLEELLRFRHFLRHAYNVDLDWARVRRLLDALPATVDHVRDDLGGFASYLTEPDPSRPT